jgi:two-component system phosphate regulon response regulator OmpR
MKKPVVLLVDDHIELRDAVEATLQNDGYDVITAGSARDLQARLSRHFDIVLLDIGLPDGDGLAQIAKIREHTDVPVIIVSAKSDMTDKVVGLEMGADDYVGKPLPLRELSSRIKAQLRRYTLMQEQAKKGAKGGATVAFGSWVLDRNRMQVFTKKGESCNLTAKEFRLLETLVDAANRVLTREQILNHISPDNLDVTDRAVDIQILRIRKKIGDASGDGQAIQTVRGVGYMLSAQLKPSA